ncbi:unnamed protein product [Linum tenue]|uniref:Reverse transcriptase zinc-binding domain-containing protein n=1 Tax=Linum tenue TaxID=586396 RepID=A0AAV0MTM5_9ROSI|nr:unnamed protein product [Linum tenue]
MCKHCRTTEETTEHILRKCGKTAGLWRHFRNKLKVDDNRINFQTWLIKNMMDQHTGVDFGIICWNLWKQRNEEAMDGKSYSEAGLIQRVNAWINIYSQALINAQKCLAPVDKTKSSLEIAWKPPREG